MSKSLLHLYSVQKNTQEKLDSLHILFNNINQDLEVISLKKVRLEEKINYLQNKTEEDVKQEAVYVALNEIFNKNQYIGILISLIIGVITGYVANLLTRKKDMEATRQLYEENLYHSQKHKQIQNE
ncbi:hypothetical protein AGMMS50262_18550 [Bacteroidia bacterium]|nr:hypothetical protein AGMMS50262_18550 [Bacteroidia bacterium]